MCCNNPEPIVLSFEGLYGSALVEIPDSNSLIFAYREYEILMGMEQTARGILKMPTARIYFPGFGFY